MNQILHEFDFSWINWVRTNWNFLSVRICTLCCVGTSERSNLHDRTSDEGLPRANFKAFDDQSGSFLDVRNVDSTSWNFRCSFEKSPCELNSILWSTNAKQFVALAPRFLLHFGKMISMKCFWLQCILLSRGRGYLLRSLNDVWSRLVLEINHPMTAAVWPMGWMHLTTWMAFGHLASADVRWPGIFNY